MPQDRLRSPRGGHGRRTTSLSDFEFRVWDQYQLSADDFGVMRLSAITVQADNDNLADRPSVDVQAALDRLVAVELVASFEHQGRAYICQLDWQTFQKVEYPRLSGLPKPTEAILAKCDAATRKLFAKHPGGWKKQKGRKQPGTRSDELPEQSRNTAVTSSDETPERSPEQIPINSRKPLAVSNSSSKSLEPVADAGSSEERVIDRFRAEWKRSYGFECSLIPKPLEFMQVQQHLAVHGEERLAQATAAYFATSDEYIRKAKHPLALFLRDPLKHLAGAPKVASGRPRGCKHEPACADDAIHTSRDMADRRLA